MSLNPNFELTPRNSYFSASGSEWARLMIHGPVFWPRYYDAYRQSFDKQHENDELFFYTVDAADPAVDYSLWNNRRGESYINLQYDLSSFGANKELALVFGFDATQQSRVLVYSSAAQLDDVTLEVGDNQFLLEVETVDLLYLYFVHARHDGSNYGGSWFFRGITGYVI